jgi:hypothetical protein
MSSRMFNLASCPLECYEGIEDTNNCMETLTRRSFNKAWHSDSSPLGSPRQQGWLIYGKYRQLGKAERQTGHSTLLESPCGEPAAQPRYARAGSNILAQETKRTRADRRSA